VTLTKSRFLALGAIALLPAVALWPLLRGRVEADRVVMRGLVATIERPQGRAAPGPPPVGG
jgi:hypothetical protein